MKDYFNTDKINKHVTYISEELHEKKPFQKCEKIWKFLTVREVTDPKIAWPISSTFDMKSLEVPSQGTVTQSSNPETFKRFEKPSLSFDEKKMKFKDDPKETLCYYYNDNTPIN